MKQLIYFSIIALFSILVSCGKKHERFNYPLIKSKLDLTDDQTNKFDETTDMYMQKAHANFEKNKGNKEAALKGLENIFIAQDAEMKKLLTPTQFEIYLSEMKIEREGREKYNMKLIKNELKLDSIQSNQYYLANEAFYTTLVNNHDNYHGKPDVFMEYYKELNESRIKAFQKIMTEQQYNKYLELAKKYKLGESEH